MKFKLNGLNDSQYKAVIKNGGPLQLVSCAGSGKTRVLTYKIGNMIINENIDPSSILLTTFSKKAADEMRDRLKKLINKNLVEQMTIGTFHGIAYKILRKELINMQHPLKVAFEYDREGNSGLLPDYKKKQFIEEAMKVLKMDTSDKASLNSGEILRYIATAKNNLVDVKKFYEEAIDAEEFQIAEVYQMYEERKKIEHKIDFDDMLIMLYQLFNCKPSILQAYQNQFQYVLIDEGQDNNKVQYELARMIAAPHNNITLVGDDDQCLTYHTNVITDKGNISIGKIVNKKLDVKVLTYNEKTKEQEWCKVTNFMKNPLNDKKVYKIRVQAKSTKGKLITHTVNATENHKIAIFNDNKITYKRVDEIQIGEQIQIEDSIVMNKNDINFIKKKYKDEVVKLYNELYSTTQISLITGVDTNQIYSILREEEVVRSTEETNTLNGHYENLSIRQMENNIAKREDVRKKISKGITLAHQEGRLTGESWRKSGGWKYTKTKGFKISTHEEMLFKQIESLGFEYNVVQKTKGTTVERVPTNYKIDFGIRSKKIAIELDGGTHNTPEQKLRDHKKEKCLNEFGWTVYRIRNEQVENNIESVISYIKQILDKHNYCYDGNCPVLGEIVSIDEIEVEDKNVYDIEVEKNHNFYANGLLVHNCLYAFRGAKVKEFIEFSKHYPQLEILKLEHNYRSTPGILEAANNVIKNNKSRIDKEMKAFLPAKNDDVEVGIYASEEEEATKIAELVGKYNKQGVNYKDCAVLFRTNAQIRAIEDQFIKNAIPYVVIGGRSFYEINEVKNLISYLELVVDKNNNKALEDIINVPTRYLGKEFMKSLKLTGKKHNCSLYKALKRAQLKPYQHRNVMSFMNIVENLTYSYEAGDTPDRIVHTLIDEIDYYTIIKPKDESEEDNDKLQNIETLLSAMSHYKTVDDFLDYIAQVRDMSKKGADAVQMMTIHRSKGLEYKKVFMGGMSENLLPHRFALESGDPNVVEQERCLAYVGITRAMENLHMFALTSFNGKSVEPSRFIMETKILKEEV